MEYKTIDDVYAANNSIREQLKQNIRSLSDQQMTALPDGEKWTIAQLVEHIAMVSEGMSRICAKLLSKAEADGRTSDGNLSMSSAFKDQAGQAATTKMEAPQMVQPTGAVSIDESFAKLDSSQAAFETLREKFQKFDGSEPKFPHPYFGDLSAQEWLVLSGGHEARHLRQIQKLAERIG